MLRLSALTLLLALGASKLDGVALRWKPTEEVAGTLTAASRAFKAHKVAVRPFEDVREDKALIGRNTEDDTPRLVTTKDDVGAFCAARLRALLREAGVSTVDAEAGAELVVSGKVTHYMVEEGSTYQGRVTVAITVSSAAGKELWSGVASGTAKRFGRSYKEENYMEVLSDSFLGALDAFLNDPKLAL